ncbi:MAG: glycosyltransferase, partial [Clostridia bacterium]|nr:glycosyltransferase [Clostridia bacterium]
LDDDTLFLIYGAGNCIEDLQSRIDSENITNVKIKGYVDNKYVPYVLSKSSVNVLNYSADKYNWSRGNSSNKLFEYLASGKPVISTVKMGYDILEKNNCGFSTEVCCGESIANFIKQIKSMDKSEYQSLCDNARETAKEFDMPILANKYLSIILEVKQNFENSKKGV